MNIIHLKHKDIDIKRWNNTIVSSLCPTVYALGWYLNIVSPNWEALIVGDYKYIMPITVKHKWFIKYTVQPYFSQQLGIFSKEKIDDVIIKEFLKKIPTLSYGLNLNEKNIYIKGDKRITLTIDLNKDYKYLFSKFSKNTKRNITKAKQIGINICINDISIDKFVTFLINNNPYIKAPSNIINNIVKYAINNGLGFINYAINKKGDLIAVAFFLDFNGRKIYLLPASNDEGKKYSAMFLIIDTVIRNNVGKDEILDFEGSMKEGVARFYRGFGGNERYYYAVKRMRPNFLLKWKK